MLFLSSKVFEKYITRMREIVNLFLRWFDYRGGDAMKDLSKENVESFLDRITLDMKVMFSNIEQDSVRNALEEWRKGVLMELKKNILSVLDRLESVDPCEARYREVFREDVENVWSSYEFFKMIRKVVIKLLKDIVDESIVALFGELFDVLDDIFNKHIASADDYFYVKFSLMYFDYVASTFRRLITFIGKGLGINLIDNALLQIDRLSCLMEGFKDSIKVFKEEAADAIIAELFENIGECNFEILRDLIVKYEVVAHIIAHSPTREVALKRAKSIVEYFIVNQRIDSTFLEEIV